MSTSISHFEIKGVENGPKIRMSALCCKMPVLKVNANFQISMPTWSEIVRKMPTCQPVTAATP